jgi:hypothetical protein
VFRATLADGDLGIAICADVVEAIPPELRANQVVASGIVIQHAHSSPAFFPEIPDSDLSWSDFQGDDFYFSIDLRTAGQYLPNITGYLLRSDPE